MLGLPTLAIPVIVLALIGLAIAYGLLHVSLGGLLVCAVALVVGVYVGIQLGRNSKTANVLFDRAQLEVREMEARIREIEARTRAMLKNNGLSPD